MSLRIALMLRHIDELGGTGVYTRRITEALLRVDPVNEYLLVFASEQARERWQHLPARGLVVEARSKLLWDQVAAPRALARERVDVVFSLKHSIPLAPFAPRVFIMHGAEWVAFPQDYYPLDRLYHGISLPLYLRAAERAITISRESADRIAAYMPPVASKLSVVHHGVGPEFRPVSDPAVREAARRRLGLPERFLLYVGQVYPHKNVGGILRAFHLLRDRVPHDLVIAGRPSLKAGRDLALIERLGLEDRVRITGWLPHDELPAIYSMADAFVFPSLYEGFGIPLLEAMACGCPVVTSTAGACPEVVGDAGLCVDPADPGAIAAAIERVVMDRALAAELRRRGLDRAREFTWESAARATLAILAEAAGRASRPSIPGARPAPAAVAVPSVPVGQMRPAVSRPRRTIAPGQETTGLAAAFRAPLASAAARLAGATAGRREAGRVLMYLAGCIAFSLGVKLFVDAGLGVDPLHAVAIGLARAVGHPLVGVGVAAGGITVALLALWALLNRRSPPVSTLLTMALVGWLVDLWNLAGLERWTTALLDPVSMMLAGLLLDAYGSALIIMGGIGLRVVDLLAVAAVRRRGWPFLAAKAGVELGLVTAALLLGGPVGVGTVAFLCVVVTAVPSFMWANGRLLRLPNHGLGLGAPSVTHA